MNKEKLITGRIISLVITLIMLVGIIINPDVMVKIEVGIIGIVANIINIYASTKSTVKHRA